MSEVRVRGLPPFPDLYLNYQLVRTHHFGGIFRDLIPSRRVYGPVYLHGSPTVDLSPTPSVQGRRSGEGHVGRVDQRVDIGKIIENIVYTFVFSLQRDSRLSTRSFNWFGLFPQYPCLGVEYRLPSLYIHFWMIHTDLRLHP